MATRIRCAQINLNHSWGAQDLLAQYLLENSTDVAIISEPIHIPVSPLWFGDLSGRAAITWCPDRLKEYCILLHKDQGFVAVRLGKICFISCYIHARCDRKRKCFKTSCKLKVYQKFLDRLTSFITRTNDLDYVLAGDFNARSKVWGDTITSPTGYLLEAWMNRFDMRLVNQGSKPTCIKPLGKSVIDLTWVSPGLNFKIRDWFVAEDGESLSDHVYIYFNILTDQYLSGERLGNLRWNIKKLNIDLFHAVIIQGIWNLKNESIPTVDNKVNAIETIITNALDVAATRSKIFHKSAKHCWDNELSTLRSNCIKNKRKVAKITKKEGLSSSRHEAYLQYKHSRSILYRAIKKAKWAAWTKAINQIDYDPWGLAYKLVMKKLSRSTPALSETMSSEKLKGVLEELFPYRHITPFPNVEKKGDRIEEVTITQVKRAIRGKRTRRTAPGPDGISRDIWKESNDEILEVVKDTFNQALTTGVFPLAWKSSTLILIPKGSDNLRFRPICLINDIGKGLERILSSRIQTFMEENSRAAISPRQFGFRQGKSAIDAILAVKNIIDEALNCKQCVLVISLDIKNAFNSLSWNSIATAMDRKGFPTYLRSIVRSYLSERFVSCKDAGGGVITRKCYAGVPQGSVLGPLLWNVTYDYVLDRKSVV